MADNISSLYEIACKKGVLDPNTKSEEWFREQISTEKGLRSFYDYATNNGMKIRPYDEFKQKLQQPIAETPQHAQQNPSVKDNPAPTTEKEYQENLAIQNEDATPLPDGTVTPAMQTKQQQKSLWQRLGEFAYRQAESQPEVQIAKQQMEQDAQRRIKQEQERAEADARQKEVAQQIEKRRPMFEQQWNGTEDKEGDAARLDKVMQAATEKANAAASKVADEYADAYRYSGMQGGSRLAMGLETKRAYNKEASPDVVMNAFTQSLDEDYQAALDKLTQQTGGDVPNGVSRPMTEQELAAMYQKAGIMSPEDYEWYRQYVQGKLQEKFAAMNVPQNKMDYFVNKFMQSNLIGQLATLYTNTPYQRAAQMQGVDTYEQEHNDFGTKAVGFGADVAGLLADPTMLVMPMVGSAIGGAAVRGIAGNALGKIGYASAQDIAARAMMQRGILQTANRLAGSAFTFAGIDATHDVVNQLYQPVYNEETGQYENGDWHPWQTATAAAKGAITGTIFGGAGLLGDRVQHMIGEAWNKTAGLVAGKATHFVGGTNAMVGTSVVSQILQGRDISDINWGEEYANAAAMQLVFDIQGGVRNLGKVYRNAAEAGKPISLPEAFRQNWQRMKADPYAGGFTQEEIEQFNKAGYQGKDGYEILLNMNGGKEFESLNDLYTVLDRIAEDPTIDTQAKYRLASLIYGKVDANVRPVMTDVYQDERGRYVVRTYDNAGQTYETRYFNSEQKAQDFRNERRNETQGNLKAWQEGVIKNYFFATEMQRVADAAVEEIQKQYPQYTREQLYDIMRESLLNPHADKGKTLAQDSEASAIRGMFEEYLSANRPQSLDVLGAIRQNTADNFGITSEEVRNIISKDYRDLDIRERGIYDDYVSRLSDAMPKPQKAAETQQTTEPQSPQGGAGTGMQALPETIRKETAAEVEPNTNKDDGNVYAVTRADDETKRGYVVSGKVEIDTTDSAAPRISNNDVVTVRYEDGTIEQLSAKDLNLAAAPSPAEDVIQQITDERVATAQVAEQVAQTFHAGQEVTMDDGNGNTYTSRVVSVSEDGVEVEIENAQGEPDTTVIPNEIALTALHPVEQNMEQQTQTESTQNITPVGEGDFGYIYDQFAGKPKEAIAFLTEQKSGEALGALHHNEVGDIDLVWGYEGTGKSDGFGLAKLLKYHPEVVDNLQEILNDMHIVKRSENRIQLESDKYAASVRLTWNDEKKTWLLTAFQKKSSAINNTTDTAETRKGMRNDTATPQSTANFTGKGTTNSANTQVPAPNIDTMSSAELGAATVEYMGGDRAAAVAYLEAERSKAETEVKRLAKQSVKNYTDIADFKRQNDELQAAKKAAADRLGKLQNAITAANHYQTQAEQAEEAARKAREEEKRAARRQTQTAQLSNTTPAERWQAAPKVEGNAVTRTLPDGTTIRGHYVLVEAGAATPSHDPFNGWNTSIGFPVTEDGKNINDRDYKNDTDAQQITTQIAQTYDGQAVAQVPVVSSEGIVYDGNGRTIAGNIAAANNTDQAYIQALADNAGNFGFTAEQVAGMQHPRVYMQTDEDLPYITTTFAKFNAQEKKSQGSTNRAVSSSKKLTEAARDGMLRILDNYGTLDAFFASETGAKDIVRSLLDNGIITQQEVAGLTENTDRGFVLSPAGKDYVTDLLIGGLFDEQTIRMLGNDKGLKQSILRAMPSIVENRRLGDYALTDNINNAIRLLYEARQAGMAYPLYVKQGNAFDGYVSDRFSPFEMLLAEEMSSGVENFRQVLNLYNNSARDDANGQTGLFEPRTIEDIQNEILQHYANRKQPTAAAEPTTRPANSQTEPPLPSTPTGARQEQDATDIPASNILEQIEAEAEPFEEIELTPENWYALFGEDGIVSTPIGYVKMGEHQYLKLAQKGRDGKLGMIKPTLEHPSVVVMDKSQAKDGQTTEREFSYVFVKAFVGKNGERLYYFTSITVSKDGQEVVISNQEKERSRIQRLLKNGKLAYINKATLPPASDKTVQGDQLTNPVGDEATVWSLPAVSSSTSPETTEVNNGSDKGTNRASGNSSQTSSADKGTKNIPNPQTSEQKNAENIPNASQNEQTSSGQSRSDNRRTNSEGTPKDEQSKYQRLKQERRERILREGTGFDKAFGLVSPKDITSPQQITDNIEAIVKGLALAEKALGEKGNTNTNTADITHPLSNYNGWVYGEGHIANAQHQIEGYLQALDVLDPAILNEWQKQLGIKTYGDLRNYVEKIYNETKAAQTAQLEAELSKPLSLDDKKALIKQISDGKTKVVLVTNKNIVKKLAELGATRKTIADMAAALSRGEKVNGFCGKGMVILNTDALQTGNDIIATYVHERQHLLTAAHPQLLSALTDNATADELAQILRTITGTTFYDQYNNGTTHGHTALADELVSYVMQEAYATGKDAAEVAQNYGINNETILQTLNNIDYEQRQSNSLSKARRDNILGRNTQSSSRQSGRNNQTQSQGGLVQQGSRPAGKGSSGTPSRGQTPERGEIADTPVSTLSFDEQAKSLKELISFQSKEEEQYFDSILPNLKADKLGVNAVPIEVILQENSIIERLEERVSDYVSEHYPTQANISALTDSPQGKQEREAMRKDPALAQLRKEVSEQQDAAERKINDKYEEVRAITDNPSITLGQVAQLWNDALEFCRSLDAENGIRFSVEDAGENLHKSLKGSTFAGGKPRVPKAELAAAYADMFRKQAQGQFPEGNGFAYSANYFHKFNNGRIVQSVFIDGNENLIDKIQQKYGIDSSTRPTDTNVERPQGSHRPSHSDDGLSPRQRSGNERVDRLHGAEQSDGSRDNQEIDRDTQSGRATELTDPRFSVSGTQVVPLGERTLVGLHNITSDKLRKVLKAGGLANPSAAVIDIAKQDHHGYGEISLVMPSSLVDSNSGNNAGTYTGDMWSPTYPATERRMSDKGADAYYKALNSAFGNDPARRGLWNKVSLGFSNWLAGQHDPKDFAYWYMLEKGITPENVLYNSGVPASVKQRFAPIAGKRLYEYSEEDRELLLFLIAEQRGITVGELKQEAQELRQRYQETLDDPDSLIPRKRIAQEAIEDIDTYGVKYNVLEKGIDDIQNAIRYDGKIDVNATLSKAEDYVQANYKDDFDKWLIDFDKRFGIKEYIFDGYTRNGDRKYIPDTLANASRLMNREELQNAGSHGGFNATKGQLIERMNTLADIRANKYRLTSQEGEKDGQWEQLSNEWFDNIIDPLSNMQKISDNQFSNVDYAEQRLLEALRQKDPIAHLNKEYGYSIAKDSAFAKALNDLVQRIKDLPAKYFETKFKRPVYLNEFRNAVIPNNLPQDLRDGLEQAGLGLYEYDPKAEGSRREATLQATEDDGIRFSVGTTLETDNTLTPEARKEMQAIAEQAKADGTFMQAPNGKPSNLNERQWLQVRTRAFKNWFGDWNAKHEAEVELPNRLAQWLSKENIEKAQGKSRAEIIKEFGNEPQAIAYIPMQFLPLVDSNLRDNRVYSGMGYFLDHAVNHHPNIAADKYQNIQQVLNSPDEVKAIVDNGNNSIVFIKQIDRYNAVVIEVEKTDDGRIVWHKSFYDQNKKPYANKGTRLYEMSSEGGISPIIRTGEPVHDSSLSVLDDAAKIQQNNGTAKSVDNYLRPEADFSKVIDENGEPMVVYHGTRNGGFTTFERAVSGIYFADYDTATWYAREGAEGDDELMPVFLNIRNPKSYDYEGHGALDGFRGKKEPSVYFERMMQKQYGKKAVYDGLICRNIKDFGGYMGGLAELDENSKLVHYNDNSIYIVPNPAQIKSATSNNGSFSENSDDIRFSIIGERNTPEAQYSELDYDTDNLTDAQQLATNTVLSALNDAGISVERVSEEQAEREAMNVDVEQMAVAEKFNDTLARYTDDNADNIKFDCGMPSEALLLAGMPNVGIRLNGEVLRKKMKAHQFAKEDVRNLPLYMQNPIAVFNGSHDNTFAVLTEMLINGRNTLVAIDIKGAEIQDFIEVSSLYDKNRTSVINWINDGKLLSVDKEKALRYIDTDAPIAPTGNNKGANSAAKVVQNFDSAKSFSGKSVETLRNSNGTIYGYAKDGKIYLTDRGLNPNTPIHEYTHLWVKAVRNNNAELYGNLRDLFSRENLPDMWDELDNDPQYRDLSDEAKLSEIIARFSGKRGAKRMEQEVQKLIDEAKQQGKRAIADTISFRERMRNLLRRFWNWVGEHLFHIKHFGSREEAADRVLYDLLNGTDLGQTHSENDGKAEFSAPPTGDSAEPKPRLTRGEVVTKILVQNAKNDYNTMQAALNKVSQDIKGIRAAMRLQSGYDRNVVSALLNLYNTLLQSNNVWAGYMPDTTQRVATQIVNAIGKQDISKEVNTIMGYIVDAQAKAAQRQWDKLRQTPIDKINISGVVAQGKVALQGQYALKALNSALESELTADQLEEMIGSAMANEENATDESLRTQYKGKWIGYSIAQQHLERIAHLKQERQQLLDELDAKRADKALKPAARQQVVDNIKEMLRDNNMEQANAYIQSARDLQDYIAEQGERAKGFIEKQNANREKIRGYAAKDLAGVPTNPNRLRTKRSVARSVWDAFASPIRDLQSMLRLCGMHAPDGEGYLYNHFMRNWIDGADRERQGIVEASQTLDNKIADITHGKYKTWEEAARKINNASHNKFTVTMLNGVDKDGNPVNEDIPLNAGNALYIYAVNKMEDGKMKLAAMNITDTDVEKLTNDVREKFGQEIIDVVDWVQSEYFSQLRNRYNPVHEDLFGAPMDAIENYFPLRINANARQKNEDLGDPDTEAARLLTGTSTGAIKRRTRNTLPLDVRNADFFSEVIRHIAQMERWSAFAQWTRDANILFSDIDFRNRIKGMDGTIYGSGDQLYNHMKDAFRVAVGTYKPNTSIGAPTLLNAAKGVTSAKINFRLFTAIKQLASFPAFFTYMTDGMFVKSYMRNWLKPHETMKWAKATLPNFEKRVSKRDMGDMRLMQRSTDWQWNKRILEISSKYGMAANVLFDTLTCATGARAVYDSRYAEYKQKGYTEEEAANRARQDAEMAFNTSQQSSEGAFMAPIQLDRNLATAALTVFRTSNFQYTRNLFYNIRNLKNKLGQKEEMIVSRKQQYIADGLTEEQAQRAAEHDWSRSNRSNIIGIVVYGALLNLLWRLFGNFPYLIFGNDNDKKAEIAKKSVTGGAFVSPVTGLLGGGIVEQALDGYGKISDMFAPGLPIQQDLEDAEAYLDNNKYAEFASQALSVLMQSGAGFDPQTAADMIARVVTTLDSEQDLNAAQKAILVSQAVASIPQSQYEQMLIDKVINGSCSYSDALADYQRYMSIHKAPLTWYMRNDESQEKADKSAETHFKKLYDERKELRN